MDFDDDEGRKRLYNSSQPVLSPVPVIFDHLHRHIPPCRRWKQPMTGGFVGPWGQQLFEKTSGGDSRRGPRDLRG